MGRGTTIEKEFRLNDIDRDAKISYKEVSYYVDVGWFTLLEGKKRGLDFMFPLEHPEYSDQLETQLSELEEGDRETLKITSLNSKGTKWIIREIVSKSTPADDKSVEEQYNENVANVAESEWDSNDTDGESDEAEGDDETAKMYDVDISNEVLAAIVVADVIGLFTEDNPEHHRDREVLVEQYPELKDILRSSNSVDDAIELTEQYENIEFTESQIGLMRRYEGEAEESEEVDFNDLVY